MLTKSHSHPNASATRWTASTPSAPELEIARPHPGQPSHVARSSAELTRVAWAPSEDIGLEEWSAMGRRFGEIGRCSQWWLGDWIHYGNARFGERYSRAAKLTGYDAQSLMNMVYVASRFEIHRRRESLSWSHHAALAALALDEQEHWLTRAEADRLSVADLRVELRGARRAHAELEDAGEDERPKQPATARTLVCPNCGETLPAAGPAG